MNFLGPRAAPAASAPEWYATASNVVDLARWLCDRMELSGVDETIDLFERPWRWTPEWDAMVAERDHAGAPA